MHRLRSRRGFSLVEIIIVLTIMCVLAGLLAAQYINYVEKTRATVCASNRATMMREAQVALLLAEKDAGYEDILLGVIETEHPKCESGGTYIVEADGLGTPHIICTVHGNKPNAAVFGDAETMAAIIETMNSQGTEHLDSLADTDRIASVLSMLGEDGIDLSAMGAATWHYNMNNQMLYWSMADISTMTVGDTVPVLRYNANSGSYTVWYCRVEMHTLDGKEYPILSDSSSPYTPSTTTSLEEQTYENAVELYRAACGEG